MSCCVCVCVWKEYMGTLFLILFHSVSTGGVRFEISAVCRVLARGAVVCRELKATKYEGHGGA